MENCRSGPDLEASSSHSKYGYGEPRPLNLGCRIFISHSGRDKDFVRHLHYHLVNRLYCDGGQVFFDEEILPTAEPISMENILAEARRCKLGILVLSKDFFVHTRNPMLELEALTTGNVPLLPLFFRISVEEFKKMKCENEWEERWKEWLKGDEQRLGAWKHALNFVDRFSGLEKWKLGNELRYIDEIVKAVAIISRPAVPFSEKGVCGMHRICQEVNDMYIQCASKRTSHSQTQVVSASAITVWGDDSNSSLDLVGIYGFAGLGKSTLCRGLCDFYGAEFHGRVCFLDLGSVPDSSQASSQTYSSKSAFMLRMQYLLSQLTGSNDYIQSADFCQIQNLLRNWIRKDRIFLAIDNILPDPKALQEAHFYLECEFARGSKVLITSRSSKLLEQVMSEYTKFSAVIQHIPILRFEEARDIFVREISKLGQISDVEDEVKECVSMCAIYTWIKLYDKRRHVECYHPLMLKSSAASIRHSRRPNVDLKSKLRGFLQSATAVDKSALKAVFEMLDITYAILQENEKKVFLDLALFYKVIYSQSGWGRQIYTWIQTVHSHLDKNKLDDILLYLEDLSFIVMKNVYPQSGLRLHDLVVHFSMYKIMQGVDAMGFNLHFFLLDNGTQLTNSAFGFLLAKAGSRNEWPSESNALKSVRTISVSSCDKRRDSGAQVLEQLDLRNFEGVEVLHVVDNPGLHEVLLSCNTIAHLRSFIVRVRDDSVSLRCTVDECLHMPNRMMAGGQLVWVELEGDIILSTCRKRWWLQEQLCRFSKRGSMDGLGMLRPFLCNLQYLALCRFPAESIDLTTCTNLIRMRLTEMPSLRVMHGLEALTNLKELKIKSCGPKIIDVTTCTNLIRMRLREMPSLRVIHGLEALTNLKELQIRSCGPKIIDVTTCTNLEKMILEDMPSLRAIHAVETLTYLSITRCSSLERISLPTMSNAGQTCAEQLNIWDCPVLKNVDGLLDRYTGACQCYGVAVQNLLEAVETGSSKCKAIVRGLVLSSKTGVQGLARLKSMDCEAVQHVGPFITALLKAEATGLCDLTLQCKQDGNCGCDEIGPYLGLGLLPLRWFEYHCPQVRSIASLPLLLSSRLEKLDLQGCRNVEVWPDFATMASLNELNLSHTSLKEWPTGVQLLRQLRELDIQGCWQLPVEEMINAMICNPLGCNSACGRGCLASLLADLKDCRRDQGSVADALDSRWPELVLLFREQGQYLRYPCGTLLYSCPIKHVGFLRQTGLCYLIRVLYELWFGVEGKAGPAHEDYGPCADGVPKIGDKLKRLLCSENFMSLPFYVWRIGGTRVHGLDEWEGWGNPWPEGYEIYMAFALIGSASIGCFNAPLNDDLKDRMVNFIQSLAEAQPQCAVNKDFDMSNVQLEMKTSNVLDKDAHERLAMRVGDAVCQMVRAPNVAAALGQGFMHITVDGLKARYCTIEVSSEVFNSLTSRMRIMCHDGGVYIDKGKISCMAAESGSRAPMYSMSLDDDLGARVLRKIMPKILSISVLDFHVAIDGVNDGNCCCHGVNDGNCCCRESKCDAIDIYGMKKCCYFQRMFKER